MESGWNVWGGASECGEQEAGESMGVATGCGCKEVYRFPHTTYPYSSCICSFLQQHPYLVPVLFCNYILCTKKIRAV